jgi:hypothetical protein
VFSWPDFLIIKIVPLMSPTLTAKLIRLQSLGIAIVLLLLPFHATLSVWVSSIAGHYTLIRLWKEIVLLLVGLLAIVTLWRDKPLFNTLKQQYISWLIIFYVLLQLFLGFTSLLHNQVSGKALGYGLLDDTRFILFFVLCMIIASRDSWLLKHWRQLVLIPAVIVIMFGLLQISVLPHDFLSHFGYGPKTIPAIETVNSNNHYVRVQSTLRGANPLGAYLVLILSVLSVLLLNSKVRRDRLIYGLTGAGALIVLYFTYSRGAWIGSLIALVSVGIAIKQTARTKQLLSFGVPVLIIIAVSSAVLLGSSPHFKNIIFHTSPHTVTTTSDEVHDSALRQGLSDLVHDPLGRGPGTAGPASVYNSDRPARIPENYYVQIGQEVGWLGLALFVLISVFVGVLLWRTRESSLSLALFASLIGLSVVGLVSQVWTDDTLSYIWWGLAGVALVPRLTKDKP